jgi:hypothetical protein
MSGETGVLVVRRSRAEIGGLVALYLSSGMGRSEFCSGHGIGLSTLNRHLKRRQIQQSELRSKDVDRSRLVAVELAAPVASTARAEVSGSPIVLSINRRRVEVVRGFDAETLVQLVTMLERL